MDEIFVNFSHETVQKRLFNAIHMSPPFVPHAPFPLLMLPYVLYFFQVPHDLSIFPSPQYIPMPPPPKLLCLIG